jgi:hypothetical protein
MASLREVGEFGNICRGGGVVGLGGFEEVVQMVKMLSLGLCQWS